MGDLLNNSEMLKKLGFNSSNQWILYDERFKDFFNFLSENITDDNIMTEQELLEVEELKRSGKWLEEPERLLKMQEIEANNPGLLKYTSSDVDARLAEIAAIEEATNDYNTLLDEMKNTKHSLNNSLSDLHCESVLLHNEEKELLSECQTKSRQLEELQRENCKLSEEANKDFSTQQVPPLFMHQLPLEEYFHKCDSFMQYFNLFMKDNFKMQEFFDFENGKGDAPEMHKLDSLQNSIRHYTLELLNEKAKMKATQAMIDHMNFNQIHSVSLKDMAREAHEMKMLNENHLKNTHDMLLNALTSHVEQHTQQRIEIVLYENTKQKLERAKLRRDNDKQLTRIISDALSNAELIWIAIQLDLERKKNSTDNSISLCSQAQACWQRVQAMRNLNARPKDISLTFLQQLSSQLSAHLNQNVRSTEAKSCLYEYEKFGRLLTYALQSMLNTKSQMYVHKQLAELDHVDQLLQPFVFDSPLKQPMFEKVKYLCAMFNMAQQDEHLNNAMRALRLEFKESIMDRMDNEKLWRFSQILWILFLTEPQRMLHALDEVKKSSANVSFARPGGGLRRK